MTRLGDVEWHTEGGTVRSVVSVVVPVYNSEPYLGDDGMLACVQRQTYRDLEIILVDDGSTDRSLEVCRARAEKDRRIRVISQQNGGESAARNAGIDAATGDFVSIVDHDDLLDADAYRTMVQLAKATGADLVRCNYQVVRDSGVTRHSVTHEYGVLFDRSYIRTEILPSMVGVETAVKQLPGHWTYLHRRDLLQKNRIRYDESKRKETDHRFAVEALIAAKSVALVEPAFYHFVKRAGSNTSTYSPRFDNLMDNCARYEELLGEELDFNTPARAAYGVRFVEECVFYVLAHSAAVDSTRTEVKRILSDPLVRTWYAALASPSKFSALVARLVGQHRYGAAHAVFEAVYLKTRARRMVELHRT